MAPISLDPDADTLVCIIQRGPVKFKKAKFKVLAAALSTSPYWESFIRHMDGASGFKPNKTHIEDTGITIVAVEIVLRGLHQVYHQREFLRTSASSTEGQAKSNEPVVTGEASSRKNGALGLDALSIAAQPPVKTSGSGKASEPSPEDNESLLPRNLTDVEAYFPHKLSKADIDDVWGVLALVNILMAHANHKGKFDVDWTVVEPWFLKWRETSFAKFNTQAEFEKVLFPTFAFLDSKGFRHATKWLCQNTSVGNIQEYSPLVHSQGTQWYLHLHLPKEIMSQIRIARSQLRVKVSNEIWSIVRGKHGWLSHAECGCWVVAEYNYLKGLGKAGVLCPELNRKKSIMELVDGLKMAEYEEPLDPCIMCSNTNVTSHLQSAIQVGYSYQGIDI